MSTFCSPQVCQGPAAICLSAWLSACTSPPQKRSGADPRCPLSIPGSIAVPGRCLQCPARLHRDIFVVRADRSGMLEVRRVAGAHAVAALASPTLLGFHRGPAPGSKIRYRTRTDFFGAHVHPLRAVIPVWFLLRSYVLLSSAQSPARWNAIGAATGVQHRPEAPSPSCRALTTVRGRTLPKGSERDAVGAPRLGTAARGRLQTATVCDAAKEARPHGSVCRNPTPLPGPVQVATQAPCRSAGLPW